MKLPSRRRSSRGIARGPRHSFAVERLERRSLLSQAAGTAAPTFIIERQISVGGSSEVTPAASTFAPFTPAEIDQAYGLSGISFNGVTGNGAGQTIALVDAYNDPNLVSDAAVFDANFGLQAFNVSGGPTLTVLGQTGSASSLPVNASPGSWDVEESLDVQWAHSVAPQANLVMFEANSNSFSDLLSTVTTAANYPGVSAVSMSWGGSEFSGEQGYDSTFQTPAGHQGVTFLASTGDDAAPGGYPAYSPEVVAVGGTSLTFNSNGGYGSESGWSEGGGGISQYETQPTYQAGKVNGLSSTARTIPDVSMDADPNTGVDVYDSYDGGWYQVGGTSLAAPLWAGLIAVANQGRVAGGLSTLDGPSQTLPALYNASPSLFHDVLSGNNGFAAGTGYDLVTGLGTPVANTLVPTLAGAAVSTTHLAFAQQPTSTTAGSTISPGVLVLVENASGNVITSDQSSVTLQVYAGPSGGTLQGLTTVQAVNGVATFSNLSLNTAGTYSFVATDGSDATAASSTFTVAAAAASQLLFTSPPTNTALGTPISPAVTVAVEDLYGNVVSSVSSTVSLALASGPAGATLGGTVTASTVNGIASFSNLTLNQAGTYQLLASDSAFSGKTTSGSFSVSGASKLAFLAHPGQGAAGQTLASTTVAVEDAAGTVVDADTSSVTLSIASGPAGGTLTGTLTVAAVNGLASFTNLAFSTAGSYTLIATDGTLTSATTSTITVTGPAAKLVYSVQPTALAVGATFSSAVTVAVEDASGNVVTSDSSTVTLTLASGPAGATLGGTVAAAAVNGVATFTTPWLNKPGTYTLLATDGSLSNAVSTSFTVAGPDTLNVLASFNTTNGGNPLGGVHLDGSGNLWGTTQQGGAYSEGSVFEVVAGSNKITTFFSFNGSDGNYPWTSLTAEAQGNLYGTTSGGGAYGDGTLFEIPKGSSTLNTLISFNSTDGYFSRTDLLFDSSGNLWGTNSQGGAYGYGTLFEVPAGTQTVVVRCAFTSSDAYPQGPLVMDASGDLFGSTGASGSTTFGSIYEVPAGSSNPVILYSFTSTNYGPTGLVADSAGDLFGTTEYPKGTIFEIPHGSAVQYTVPTFLYQFASYNTYPGVLSIDRLGDLFGTTEPALSTGSTTTGLVYEFKPGASTLTTLSSFSGVDGTWPMGDLAIDANGDLFGATNAGGTSSGTNGALGVGEVYELQAPHLVFTTQPTSGPIGATITPAVTVVLEDANGNVVADASSVTLSLASGPSGATLAGTVTEPLVNGVATFSNLSIKTGGTYTLAAVDGIDGAGVSSAFTEASGAPGVAASLQFVQQPTATPAGAPIQPAITVEVLDGNGNVVTGDTSTITLTLASGPTGGTLGGTVSATAVNGIATFSNLELNTAGAYTLSASDGSLTGAISSSVNITPLHLVFATEPTNTAAGTPLNPAVVVDVDTAAGVIDTADNSSVTLSISSGPAGGTLLGTTTVTAVNGVATFSNVAFPLVGTYTLSTTDGSWTGAVSSSFAISPAAAVSLAFVQQPSMTAVGSPIQPAVTVKLFDAYGNLATTDASTVTLAIATGPAGAALGGTVSVQPVNGIATFSNVSLNTAGTYTLSATDGSVSGAVSSTFSTYQSVASRLVFGVQPTATTVGGNFAAALMVKVEDQNGLVMSNDSSAVTLSIASGSVGGSAGGVLTEPAVNGVATFPAVYLTIGGTYSLKATDGSLTPAVSSSFTVNGSYALKALIAFSSYSDAGSTDDPIIDSAGDVFFATGGSFGNIYEKPAGSNTFSIIASSTAANTGSVGDYFQGLVLDSSGNLFGVTRWGSTYSNGAVFEVPKGTSSIVLLAPLPNACYEQEGGTYISIDSAGNVYGTANTGGASNDGYLWEVAHGSNTLTTVASFNGTNGSDPQSDLVFDSSGNLYGTTFYGGTANYGTVFEVPKGSGTITTLASFAGNMFNGINGVAGEPTSNLLIDSNGDLFGTDFNDVFELAKGSSTITTVASFGSTYAATSHLVIDGNGNLFGLMLAGSVFEVPAGSTTPTIIASFDGYDGEIQEGLAMDLQGDLLVSSLEGGPSYTGGSTGFGTIDELQAPHLAFLSQPGNIAAGSPVTATVAVEDPFGNVIASDNSTISFSLDGQTLGVKAVNGIATFSDSAFTVAGNDFLKVSDSLNSGVASVTSQSFTISPGPAAKLAFAQQPTSITAGGTINPAVTVDVEDAYGNLITGNNSTVTLSLKSGTGTGLGTLSVAAVNGVATFANLSIQKSGSYSLTAADGQLSAASSNSFVVSAAAASQLVFVQQPTGVPVGTKLPTITVAVEDAFGNLVTSDTSLVSLATALIPAGLLGNTTVSAVAGLATFSGLSLTAQGNYTLTATDGSLSSATSNPFTITPLSTSTTLTTPGSSTSNATQPLSFTAAVTGGVPDGETVSLEDANNNNAVVATATLAGGNATFTLPAGTLLAGTHELFAVYGGDGIFAASQSSTLAQTVQVVVTSVVVNGNLPALAGGQRSMVDSIVYSFSEPVNVGANAFTIAIHTGQTGTIPTLSWTAINPSADGSSTQWAVTFSGNGVLGNSIDNGVYDITMNPAAVTSEANPTVAAQPRATDTFWRLFGDFAGNGYVSNADYNAFLSTYNLKSTAVGYLAAFDATGTGAKISNADYLDFLSTYGTRYRNITSIATI